MKAFMHYIIETKDGKWKWWTVPMGGLRKPGGPRIKANAQVTLGDEQFTLNPQFNRRYVEPRPSWAIGMILLGFMGLGAAEMTAAYAVGAAMFAAFGVAAMVIGALGYQKSLHTYALFVENIPMQVPFIRKWADKLAIQDAIEYTSQEIAQDAGNQLGREILNPAIPWGFVIAAAIAGIGGGAIIGMLASRGGK